MARRHGGDGHSTTQAIEPRMARGSTCTCTARCEDPRLRGAGERAVQGAKMPARAPVRRAGASPSACARELRKDDFITTRTVATGTASPRAHRGPMFAELLGKEAGTAAARRVVHIADRRRQPRRERDRRRSAGSPRGRAVREDARDRPGLGLLLRRWALGQGLLYESMNRPRCGSCPSSTSARTPLR